MSPCKLAWRQTLHAIRRKTVIFVVTTLRTSKGMRVHVAVVACWAAAVAGAPASDLTAVQWRADVALLAKELPQRHRNLFHALPKAEFERRVAGLDAAIPNLSEPEIRAGIARLVAAVGDGHTTADVQSDRNLRFK